MPRGTDNTALKIDDSEEFATLVQDLNGKVAAMNRTRAMIEFTPDGTILDANDLFLHAMGYSREEVIGQHHRMFVDAAEREGLDYKGFWDRLSRGEDFTGEFRRVAKGGREIWIQGSYTPILNANGRVSKVVKYAADITDDVRSRNSTARLQGAVSNLTTAVMMIDRDLNVTYVNEATRSLLKRHTAEFRKAWPTFEADKIIGACIDQFHKEPSHQRRLLADPSNLPHVAEIRIGSLRIRLCINATFDAAGAYVGNSLEWSDVTEQRAQEEINADFANQIATISRFQAVIEFKLDGTIVEANENFLNAMGYSMEEIRGKHHSMFVDPAERSSNEYREFWDKLGRGEYQASQYKRVTKSGKDIWLQASYNPINDINGKPVKVVKFASDISAQRELAERVKEISNVVSSAASEMRATAESMARTASESTQQASAVASAAEVASANVQTVSAASEELSASILQGATIALDHLTIRKPDGSGCRTGQKNKERRKNFRRSLKDMASLRRQDACPDSSSRKASRKSAAPVFRAAPLPGPFG